VIVLYTMDSLAGSWMGAAQVVVWPVVLSVTWALYLNILLWILD